MRDQPASSKTETLCFSSAVVFSALSVLTSKRPLQRNRAGRRTSVAIGACLRPERSPSFEALGRPKASELLRNATSSVFYQRHVGRLRRSSCRFHGRRTASFLGGETRPGRCPALWPGHLRNDAGRVAVAGKWAAARMDDRVDGTLRPHDRRGQEVRRVEHLDPPEGRLERGALARRSGKGRRAAEAGVRGGGQGTVRGRRDAPAGIGG